MGEYNGSGVFVRTFSWANDKTNGIKIIASRMDTEDNGFATGLSTAVCKDGQQICTAQVPFAVGISVPAGGAGAPGVAVLGDLTTGIYQSAAGALDVTVSGTRVGGFTSAGLVNTAITTSTLGVTGNFAVNTNKFTVNASTGNTVIAGTLVLNGSVSGTATIRVKATAGSVTFQLPTTNGSANNVLISDGSGNTSWAVGASGTVNSGTINQLAYYASSAAAVSTTSAIPNGITATTQAVNDSSTKVATTAFANPSYTAGNNGTAELPGGLIIKQGNGTTSGAGTLAVSFTSAFPNNLFAFVPSVAFSGVSQLAATFTSPSTSGATIQVSNASSGASGGAQTVHWIAIGN